RGQLMCEALDFLRECCGDKIFLGCGVPLGPAFGVVDACRIGCDAETSFKDKFYVGITNQEVISTRNAMNNAIFRRHLNGRIMANDPDVFFLRNGGVKAAKYDDKQKKLLARINHMFGSVLFVSDNVGEYDDGQLAVLLDAYKKFEGKVLSAEYSGQSIRIVYIVNGVKHKLIFNTITGEYTDKSCG
ncbi:MAG: alpha-galactosidase, partial [Clostridia bacterium]|nr:alpha-galactosidase [Clostridia bacterium]